MPKKRASAKKAKKPSRPAGAKAAKKGKRPKRAAASAPKRAAKKGTAKKGTAKKVAAKKAAPKRGKKQVAKKASAKKAATKKVRGKKAPSTKGRRSKQIVCPLSGLTVTPGNPRLAPSTIARLRELLEEERARHLHQAEELQAEAEVLATERDQGDTQFDEESGEGDTVSVERERSLLLSASARQAVEEIDRALARMDAGTYGVCVPAGRPITLARLEAIPWAETCVECAQRVARRR